MSNDTKKKRACTCGKCEECYRIMHQENMQQLDWYFRGLIDHS